MRSQRVVLAFVFAVALPAFVAAQDKSGGQAVSRGGDSGGGGGAVSRGGGDSGGGGAVSRGSGDSGGGPTVSRPTSSTPPARTPITSEGTSRPREDRTPVGRAIPRPADLPVGAGNSSGSSNIGTVYYGGYYPWGYGGLGLGGYYGWYDPWGYDPYYGGGYGYGYGRGYYSSPWDGGLRLRVKPNDAEVYVDGYYAGIVDEFDNVFQHLRIETGPHRIEVRQDGYEPLTFEVRILPDRTITYKGQLKRLP
jgi:hypothetical protein